jgi:type IV secretion system protein VirD4
LIVNHDVKIGFTPGDLDDAKDLAAILGTYTTTSTSVSSNRSSNHLMAINANASAGVNVSEQKRDLLMPQELLRMPLTREIVCKTGLRPIDAQKIFYYKEPVFVDRLKRVSPSLHALGKDLPTQDQLEAARIAGELAAPVPLLPIEDLLKALSGDRAPKESEAASAMTVDQVDAAAKTLAAQISDWSALSSVSDIKAHISKAFFMQEFLGTMAGGSHVAI